MKMKIYCLVACALALVGCDDAPITMTDAGVMSDAGVDPDLPPVGAFTEGATAFEPTALDYGCLGALTAPAGGDTIDVEFQLRDFQDDFEVPDTDVWLFRDNQIADDCSGQTCQAFTTNTMGNASVMLPARGWYAYRVLPQTGPTPGTTVFGVFQYNEPAPAAAGGSVEANSVSGTTIDLIPALLGITREEGRAIVAGRIFDCNDANIANAVIRLYDPDGNFIQPGERDTDPKYHYFTGLVTGNVPAFDAEFTAADGLYVAPQIPLLGDRPYRVEAWANFEGTFQRVSCESARIFADSITILNLGPMRSDPDPACAM